MRYNGIRGLNHWRCKAGCERMVNVDALMMSDFEISQSYRCAKNRRMQIQILADLNCVTYGEMLRKLVDMGLVDRGELKGKAAKGCQKPRGSGRYRWNVLDKKTEGSKA